MQKKKNKKVEEEQELFRNPNSFVSVLDMKASFFIAERKDEEKVILRLDEGRYKGIIVELSNFNFKDDSSSVMNFDYNVIYTPTGKIPNEKNFEMIVKKLVKKIIEYAVKNVMGSEINSLASTEK